MIEKREGHGVVLFIDEKCNYGLNHFKQMSPDDTRYESYQKWKKLRQEELEENGCITLVNHWDKTEIKLGKKQSEAFIKCMFDCAAIKMNNYEKYCYNCSCYYKNVKEEE